MSIIPRFIRSSIQSKLFASFLTVLLLLVAVVIASFLIIHSLGKASDNILKMNYNSIIASMNMMDDLEGIHREFISLATADYDNNRSAFINAQNSFSEWLGRSKDNITEPGEKEAVAQVDAHYSHYLLLLQEVLANPQILDQSSTEINQYRRKTKSLCMHLLEVNQKAMFKKSSAAQKISQEGTATLFVIAVLVLLLGVILSWGLSRRIVLPILKLKLATQRIAKGDYGVQLHQESEDELGILTQEFDEMAKKLRSFNELNIRTIVAEQQKIEAIFANIQDGIFFIGTDYTILDANLPALEAFKLKLNEVKGHHFLEIIKQDHFFADLKQCLETQTAPVYLDQKNLLTIKQGDKQLYFEYSFTPVLSHQKELLGAMFLMRDITHLKELDRLKSEFVMIVSHELKTPLTSINMSIDLLRESLGKDPRAGDLELINIAKEEITRLRLLVNDLLDLSKIEAGKIELKFSSVAPLQLLGVVYQSFKKTASEKQTELSIECPDDIGNIYCDEEKLLLVFFNLVANALKSITKEGKIKISAETSGDFVMFCVQDNGVGIPLAYQNKVFDRFVQVAEHKAAGGTGLGLAISREIVRAHGGSIWIESEPGKGAAFYFTIPQDATNQLI